MADDFVTVTCSCGNVLKTSAANAGKKGRCPKCKKLLDIPAVGAEPEEGDTYEVNLGGPAPAPTMMPIQAPPPKPAAPPAAKPKTPSPARPASPPPAQPAPPAAKPASPAQPPGEKYELKLVQLAAKPVAKPAAKPGAKPAAEAAAKAAEPMPTAAPAASAEGMPLCKNHRDREAANACVGCMSFVCDACSNTHKGITFCNECLPIVERAKSIEAKDAQQVLMRKKGMAAGDFSKEFKARTGFEAVKHAVQAMQRDSRYMVMALGLIVGFGTLSSLVLTFALRKHWPWLPLAWLPVAVAWQIATFGGFIGTAKDMLFALPWDSARFFRYCIRGFKVNWMTALLFPVTAFLTGPVLWAEPDGIVNALIGGLVLGILLTIALPAVLAAAENSGAKTGFKCFLHYMTSHFTTLLPMNIMFGALVWIWMYAAKSDAIATYPIAPDVMTGFLVALIYVIWIVSSLSMYYSLDVPKVEVNSKAPPAGMPVPNDKRTNLVVGIVLACAVAATAPFYVMVQKPERRLLKDYVSKVNFKAVNPFAKAPAPPPAPPTPGSKKNAAGGATTTVAPRKK